MTYSFYTNKTQSTPQTEPIPGRESEMIQGKSGGYMFDAGIWAMLRRCLILGTASDQYYSNKMELTGSFVNILKEAIALDPKRVADEILYASDGHAVNNHAPIFALVLLSMGSSKEAKQAFRDIFNKVIRTGSHFHEWMFYTKQLRGIGRTIREVGTAWLTRTDVSWLVYQMLKYPQRNDFSFRDELRLLKPAGKDLSPEHNFLYGYVTGKMKMEVVADPGLLLPGYPTAMLNWYEWLKANPSEGVRAVKEGKLTHEMVAPICHMSKDVWQVLFEQMPIGALLRNLASLTEIGVLTFDNVKNLDRVEEVLTNKEYLKRGRIHPVDVLKALKTYESCGALGKSKKTWQKIDRIVDILEKATELAFETLEPTNKVFLHAIDVSGSMSWDSSTCGIGLKACEVAAVMALATAKAEKNYIIRGFSDTFRDLGITAKDTFSSACRKTRNHNHGGTNASVAYQWAIDNKVKVDVFCFWTDGESWAGYSHPSQVLAKYRKAINPNAKAVYVTVASNRITLVDPKDPMSFDFGGFDPSIPKAIQEIALM